GGEAHGAPPDPLLGGGSPLARRVVPGDLPRHEHLHHVRVVESTGDPRLSVEALHHPWTVQEIRVEDLHGHGALDAPLMATIDPSHGAHADERAHLDLFGELSTHPGVVLGFVRWHLLDRKSTRLNSSH